MENKSLKCLRMAFVNGFLFTSLNVACMQANCKQVYAHLVKFIIIIVIIIIIIVIVKINVINC